MLENERRDFMRLATHTKAAVERLATGETLIVELVDLSAAGCGFRSSLPMAPGEALIFRVQGTNPRFPPLERRGQVVRGAPLDGSADLVIGVTFDPD